MHNPTDYTHRIRILLCIITPCDTNSKGLVKSGSAVWNKSIANAVASNNNTIKGFSGNSTCFNYNNGSVSSGNSEGKSVNDSRLASFNDY
jgi:hypothetical protein